jgi:hypothetical protein
MRLILDARHPQTSSAQEMSNAAPVRGSGGLLCSKLTLSVASATVSHRFMSQNRSHRWLALFFVVFAIADCCFSEYCCGEKRIGSLCCDEAGATIIASDDSTEHSSSPLQAEEECFCCCTHILPSIHFAAASLDTTLPENDLTNPHLPSPPPQNTFHPPRFS